MYSMYLSLIVKTSVRLFEQFLIVLSVTNQYLFQFDWGNITMTKLAMGVHGRVIKVRSLTSNHLPLTAVGSKTNQGIWMWRR
jgi:hypothetical protein